MEISEFEFLDGAETEKMLIEYGDKKGGNICIIFGAGASYGYTQYKMDYLLPPTVSELFEDSNSVAKIVIHDPKHHLVLRQRNSLKRTLEKRFGKDLERFLSQQYDKHDQDDIFTWLLIYLQDVYNKASEIVDSTENNYQRLISHFTNLRGNEPWSCISFNYDTILEQSYAYLGRNRARAFDNIESYHNYNPKIFKIHGGVNFRYRIIESAFASKKSDKDIFGLMMNQKAEQNPYIIAPGSSIPEFCTPSLKWNAKLKKQEEIVTYDFPLMMIPVHGTKKSENPFFVSMIEAAKNEIESSDLVVAIGYNFGDETLENSLKQINFSKKKLILVGGKGLVDDPKNHRGFVNASRIWKGSKINIFKGNSFSEFVNAVT